MPKNEYDVFNTVIMDNFWSVIASTGTIAENIFYFFLEEMILSHMWGESDGARS